MIQVLEEPVEVTGLFKFSITDSQHGSKLFPGLAKFGNSLNDNFGLFGMSTLNFAGLTLQGGEFGLNGRKVAFHS